MGDKVIFCVIIKMPNNAKKNNTAKNKPANANKNNKKNNTVNNNKKNNTVNNNKKNNTVNNNKKNNTVNNNKKNNTVNNKPANNKKNNTVNNNKKNNTANNNGKNAKERIQEKVNEARANAAASNAIVNNASVNEAVQHCQHSLPFIREKAKNLGNNNPDANYWKASLNFLEEHCPIIEKHANTNSSKNYVKRVNTFVKASAPAARKRSWW
jgi:hypothetical protein